MVVEISSCFVGSTAWAPLPHNPKRLRRRAPLIITDRQGTDVDLELWHGDVMCGGLLISARSQTPGSAQIEPALPRPQRAAVPRPIAIDISRCTELRLGLLCALGDNGVLDSAPDTEGPWTASIEPQSVLRFMVGPVASQHALTIGRASEAHVEIDVLSCCVGDGSPLRRDVCAQLSVRAAYTNVYDFGARSTLSSSFVADKVAVAQLQAH